jgi:hypothetical protein
MESIALTDRLMSEMAGLEAVLFNSFQCMAVSQIVHLSRHSNDSSQNNPGKLECNRPTVAMTLTQTLSAWRICYRRLEYSAGFVPAGS